MKQALPRVSIIVPTWNGRRYIDNCLNSLLRQAYPSLEVIVVDNASTDGTPQVIAEHFPTVKLIHNDRNLGFSGGVNVGLRTAEGDALIFFNQDAAAEPEWLRLLISGLYAAPDIGVVGCRILNLEDQTIQHAAGYLNLPRALPASLNVDQSETDQDCQPVDVEFVTGAAFGLHRRVFEAIGGLDDSFFFYFEDVDYCYRARAAGFRVVYIPSAAVRHYGNASLGAGTVSYYANFHTSRLLFVMKHLGVSYFASQLRPTEYTWLESVVSQAEQAGLRQAYQTLLEGVGSMGQDWSLDDDAQVELISALQDLRQQVYAVYPEEALRSPEEVAHLQKSSVDRWWEVQEAPFTSSVPLLGKIIARFRTLWNNVSTTWFVRAIRQQQNEVNRVLVRRLEMQGQIMRDLDRDQTRLTTQMAEILFRLDKLEAHLSALEERSEKR